MTDWGPSSTSAVCSSPRTAGRQFMKMAAGFASFMAAPSIWKGLWCVYAYVYAYVFLLMRMCMRVKRPVMCQKRLERMAKGTYGMPKETYYTAKETY